MEFFCFQKESVIRGMMECGVDMAEVKLFCMRANEVSFERVHKLHRLFLNMHLRLDGLPLESGEFLNPTLLPEMVSFKEYVLSVYIDECKQLIEEYSHYFHGEEVVIQVDPEDKTISIITKFEDQPVFRFLKAELILHKAEKVVLSYPVSLTDYIAFMRQAW